MTHDNEAIVRHAYHTAEGSVLDVAGFVGSFANDGVINLGHAGMKPGGVGEESYRGEHLGDLVLRIARLFPDIHRELHRVNVLGDMVAVERDGKIEMFNCYIMLSTMRAQMGVPERG
jgi:ketosteroid isomerase-like protein